MNTIIFYVLMTVTGIDGVNSVSVTEEAFEPLSWQVSDASSEERAYEECSIIANAYLKLKDVKEVDCYAEETR